MSDAIAKNVRVGGSAASEEYEPTPWDVCACGGSIMREGGKCDDCGEEKCPIRDCADCAPVLQEEAGAANAGAEPLEWRLVMQAGSSDTPLFPGRATQGPPVKRPAGVRSAGVVAAAVRRKLAAMRVDGRHEFEVMLAASPGLGSRRARAVLRIAGETGVDDAWAYPAAAIALLLPGAPPAGAHDMDGGIALGVRWAAAWLHERKAPGAERFTDYARGLRWGAP